MKRYGKKEHVNHCRGTFLTVFKSRQRVKRSEPRGNMQGLRRAANSRAKKSHSLRRLMANGVNVMEKRQKETCVQGSLEAVS